ncbi:MAG: response regulator [Nitrospirae bacterium]|nr:response regulator [Nitrospirota bacterium]
MPKWGIKTKLVILVLTAVLPIFVLNFYLLFKNLKHDKLMLEQSALHQSQMVSDEIDQAIFESRQHLSTFSEFPAIKNKNWQKCSQFLSHIKSQYPYYGNIFAADTNGWIRCSAVPYKEMVNIKDRAYFKEVTEKKVYTIGEVAIGRIIGKPVVVLAYPVLDQSNNLTAIIGASLSLLSVNKMFTSMNLIPNTAIILTDQKGRIVTSNIESEKYTIQDISSAAWFQEILKRKDGILTLQFMGEERLTAITSPKMTKWNSIVGIPASAVYGPLRDDLLKSILFSLLILSISLFIAISLGRYLTGPISKLSKEVKEVGAGNFRRLINIKTGDEVEVLASSFNEMVKKLDERKVENEKLQKQFFLSQKMEAIGTLTGGIAHDFNNMLNVILGYSQLAMEDADKNSQQYRHFKQIYDAGRSAADLTGQLLAFSRRGVIDPKIISINDIITTLEKMLKRLLGANIELKLVLAQETSNVMADKGQIEQVIMNLCVNARDAMPNGGQISLETINTHLDEAYCVTHPWAEPGSYAMLSITDTGMGMDEETQARIFEPFFTTKELGKGTGLGLAVVYGIVKQHNGLIHVYSQKGQGTTFKIYLPAFSGQAEASAMPKPAELKGGDETILLAEDNDMLREVAETILKKFGYTTLTAKNGDEAVQIFNANSNKISLAILDIVMPVCGGEEAFARMSAIKPGLKVLFVTGYSASMHHTDFISKERHPFLQKPFSQENLARKVREALDR